MLNYLDFNDPEVEGTFNKNLRQSIKHRYSASDVKLFIESPIYKFMKEKTLELLVNNPPRTNDIMDIFVYHQKAAAIRMFFETVESAAPKAAAS